MKDFLIVGGGIAGHCFAHILLENKMTFDLVDSTQNNHCSKVAAGLYNPISLRRTSLAWRSLETLEISLPFYRNLEKRYDAKFLYEACVRKIYANHEEANDWEVKSIQENYKKLLNASPSKSTGEEQIIAPFGMGEVQASGYMDINKFLSLSEKLLSEKGMFINAEFNYDELGLKKEFVYGGEKYKRIIFCEGVGIKNNPFFRFVPIIPNKGVILEILFEKDIYQSLKHIYSKSMFLIPLGAGRFRVGSTYERNFDKLDPEPASVEKICEKLKKFVADEFTVDLAKSGIRPTTVDRKPVAGEHPEIHNMFLLNGLGSRGVLLAPYLSQLLFEHIFTRKNLLEEVNVKKHYPLFYA